MSPTHFKVKSLSGKIFTSVLAFTLAVIVALSVTMTTIYYLSYEHDAETELAASAQDAARYLNATPSSENAPAPENPVVIRQGSQFAHGAPACFGHTRSSTAKPLSTMTMRPVKPRSKRESAQKIPAGPAPTMTTSVSMVRISTLLFPRRSDGAIRVLHHCTPPAVGSSGIRRRERNSRSERMLRMRSSDAERGLPAKFL